MVNGVLFFFILFMTVYSTCDQTNSNYYTTLLNVYSLNISLLEIKFKSLCMYKDPLILMYITMVYPLVINISFKNLPFLCQWYHLTTIELEAFKDIYYVNALRR